jgi:hypothetical protein
MLGPHLFVRVALVSVAIAGVLSSWGVRPRRGTEKQSPGQGGGKLGEDYRQSNRAALAVGRRLTRRTPTELKNRGDMVRGGRR